MKPPILTNARCLFSEVKRLELEAEYSPLSRAKFEKQGALPTPRINLSYDCSAAQRIFFLYSSEKGRTENYLLRTS